MLSNLNKSFIDLLEYRAQLMCYLKDEYENIMSEVASRQGMSKKTPNDIITSTADSEVSQEPSKESTEPKEEAAIEKTSDELEGVVFSSSKELMALINDEHAK